MASKKGSLLDWPGLGRSPQAGLRQSKRSFSQLLNGFALGVLGGGGREEDIRKGSHLFKKNINGPHYIAFVFFFLENLNATRKHFI